MIRSLLIPFLTLFLVCLPSKAAEVTRTSKINVSVDLQWHSYNADKAPWAYRVWESDFKELFSTWEEFRAVVAVQNVMPNTDEAFARVGSGQFPNGFVLPKRLKVKASVVRDASLVPSILRAPYADLFSPLSLPVLNTDKEVEGLRSTISGLKEANNVLTAKVAELQSALDQQKEAGTALQVENEKLKETLVLQSQKSGNSWKMVWIPPLTILVLMGALAVFLFRKILQQDSLLLERNQQILEKNAHISQMEVTCNQLATYKDTVHDLLIPFTLHGKTRAELGGPDKDVQIWVFPAPLGSDRIVFPGSLESIKKANVARHLKDNFQARTYLVRLGVIPGSEMERVVADVDVSISRSLGELEPELPDDVPIPSFTLAAAGSGPAV